MPQAVTAFDKESILAKEVPHAETAALLYSLIASAQRHSLDPQRYLTSILAQLPGIPPDRPANLLSEAWKRADMPAPQPQ